MVVTIQMVQWLSSVSTNQCQMCALVHPIFFFTASDAWKVVYIHVSCCNISEFKFSMECVRIINIAKPLYHHQKHPKADTPYIGPRVRMSTCTCPRYYDCNLKFSALPV